MRGSSATPYNLIRLTIAWVISLTAGPVATLEYLPDLNRLSHRAIDSPKWCGTRTYGRNGYVYSHEKARELASGVVNLRWEAKENHYPTDANCSLSIYAGLENDLPPIESTQSTILLLFITDGNCKNGEGFIVQFSAFRTISGHLPDQEQPRCHPRDEFRCDNNRCIPLSFLCDIVTQCIDGTDEPMQGCSHDGGLYGLLNTLRENKELMAMLCIVAILAFLLFILSFYCCVKWTLRQTNRVHAVI